MNAAGPDGRFVTFTCPECGEEQFPYKVGGDRIVRHSQCACERPKPLTKRGNDDDWTELFGPVANPPPNCS